MRIGILSRAPRCYSTRRLRAACRERGHEVRILDVLNMAITLEEGYPDIYYHGEPLEDLDAIIPRIGASITYFGTAAVRQLQQMDVFTLNSATGINNSRDKLRSLQILSRHQIGMPPTEFVSRKQDVLPAIERVGGAPVILKLLEGTQGIGVILAESTAVARAIVETLQSARQNVLIQKFVAESKGRDIRALVVGERVVAAMRRVAQGQEFRSNFHLGARAEPVELDESYTQTAIRAAQILGLRFAGVDILESAEGPQVMEVNSSPGLQGIEAATRIDVAGAVVDYIADMVQFPDMDLRQRLTVSRGFGVAELPVREGSSIRGLSLEALGREHPDIAVLTLYRGDEVVSNPRGGEILESGDRLLCYGLLTELKSLMPASPRRRLRKLSRLPEGPAENGAGEPDQES